MARAGIGGLAVGDRPEPRPTLAQIAQVVAAHHALEPGALVGVVAKRHQAEGDGAPPPRPGEGVAGGLGGEVAALEHGHGAGGEEGLAR